MGGHPSGPGDLSDLNDCNLSKTVARVILTAEGPVISSKGEGW